MEFHILGSASEKIGKTYHETYPEDPTPIRELLDGERLKAGNYLITIDGKAGSLQTPVCGNDKVVIMPLVSGG